MLLLRISSPATQEVLALLKCRQRNRLRRLCRNSMAKDLNGRMLKVNEAKERTTGGRGGFGGGNRGGGPRRGGFGGKATAGAAVAAVSEAEETVGELRQRRRLSFTLLDLDYLYIFTGS
jgi:hypothetical protein